MKKVELSDWIMVGAGKLFGVPFCGHCLLYRLYDCDRSILIHHESQVAVTSTTKVVHGASTHEMHAVHHRVDTFSIRVGMSAETAAESLLQLPGAEFSFLEIPSAPIIFGPVTLSVKPTKLLLTSKIMCFGAIGKEEEYSLGETEYRVAGRARLAHLGSRIPFPSRGRPSYEILMASTESAEPYDFNSKRPWSLSACKLEPGKNGKDVLTPLLTLTRRI